MTFTQQNIQDIGAIVAANIKQLVPDMIREIVRDIVKEETADLHQNVELIRQVQTHRGIMLRTIQTDLSQTKESTRHLGILYEVMEDQVTAQAQILSDNLKVDSQVKDHESRLQHIETTQLLLTATASAHSRQLKAKTKGQSWYSKGHGRSSKGDK